MTQGEIYRFDQQLDSNRGDPLRRSSRRSEICPQVGGQEASTRVAIPTGELGGARSPGASGVEDCEEASEVVSGDGAGSGGRG